MQFRMIKAIAMAAALTASPAMARDLTVVGFGGGFQDNARKHLFETYAKASGKPVKDDSYNGEMAKIYAMTKANDVTWDVIMVEAPELARGCEDGAFVKLDWKTIDRSKFIDNGTTDCGAGAVAWGTAVFWDKSKFPTGPQNFAEFWDVKKFPGKRSLRFSPKAALEAAIMADGVAPADVYKVLAAPGGVDRAFAKLDQIKSDIVWWRAGAQPFQLIGSGEVAFSTGFVGRVAAQRKDGKPFDLAWDTLLWSFDYWAVIKGSPNAAEGQKLISHLTDFDPLLAMLKDWPLAPANKTFASRADLRQANPDMLTNHTNRGVFLSTEFWIERGEDLEKRFNSWAAR
jgi:putative spermidine/putrescine transport system substrate-binding protein